MDFGDSDGTRQCVCWLPKRRHIGEEREEKVKYRYKLGLAGGFLDSQTRRSATMLWIFFVLDIALYFCA
jgi:hypothetical protein